MQPRVYVADYKTIILYNKQKTTFCPFAFFGDVGVS